MNDWELLDQFRLSGSQQAFAELVRRHAGFVHATCRRRLRDAHLAEDVTQAVFIVLSRRPPLPRQGAVLAGWLYQTAMYACNNALRAEQIRQRREREAAQHRERAMDSDSTNSAREIDVQLDQAMSSLPPQDRDALLLRYYQDHQLREVGNALGISQNTAAKRLSRAVERLRRALSDRGVMLSSVAIGEAIARATREPVSSELITKITDMALGHALTAGAASATSATSISIAEGVTQMIRHTQIKIMAATVCAVVFGIGGLIAVGTLLAHQAKTEAAAPATQPAAAIAQAVKPDPDMATPQGTLRAFARAIRASDVDKMRSLVHADGAADEELLTAACNYVEASGAFLTAVKDKFGDQAAAQFSGRMQLTPIDNMAGFLEQNLEKAQVEVNNEVAKVSFEGAEDSTMCLVKENENWKISAADTTASWSPQQKAQRSAGIQQAAVAMDAISADIASGQFNSMEELVTAIQGAFGRR